MTDLGNLSILLCLLFNKLVIRVPLKTAAQLFSLFKIIVFPMRFSPDSFLKYQLEYHYFGLAVDQRDFTLLTEEDLQRCTTSSVIICPAEVRLYHAQLLTCEGSLFFQNANSYQLCRKNVLRHYQTPTLLHHGSKWAYHFPDPRQVNIRCPQDHGWSSRTVFRRKRTYTQRVRLPHRLPVVKDIASPKQNSGATSRRPTAVSARQCSSSRQS